MGRLGRGLLEVDPEAELESEPEASAETESACVRPDCDAETMADFKRSVKFFYKCVDKPAAEENVIECAKTSMVPNTECKVKNVYEDGICPKSNRLVPPFNPTRTQCFPQTCSRPSRGGMEPLSSTSLASSTCSMLSPWSVITTLSPPWMSLLKSLESLQT